MQDKSYPQLGGSLGREDKMNHFIGINLFAFVGLFCSFLYVNPGSSPRNIFGVFVLSILALYTREKIFGYLRLKNPTKNEEKIEYLAEANNIHFLGMALDFKNLSKKINTEASETFNLTRSIFLLLITGVIFYSYFKLFGTVSLIAVAIVATIWSVHLNMLIISVFLQAIQIFLKMPKENYLNLSLLFWGIATVILIALLSAISRNGRVRDDESQKPIQSRRVLDALAFCAVFLAVFTFVDFLVPNIKPKTSSIQKRALIKNFEKQRMISSKMQGQLAKIDKTIARFAKESKGENDSLAAPGGSSGAGSKIPSTISASDLKEFEESVREIEQGFKDLKSSDTPLDKNEIAELEKQTNQSLSDLKNLMEQGAGANGSGSAGDVNLPGASSEELANSNTEKLASAAKSLNSNAEKLSKLVKEAEKKQPKLKQKFKITSKHVIVAFLLLLAIVWYALGNKLPQQKKQKSIKMRLSKADKDALKAMLNEIDAKNLKPRDEIIAKYHAFLDLMEWRNSPREMWCPPEIYCDDLSKTWPKQHNVFSTITQSFSNVYYGMQEPTPEEIKRFRGAFVELTSR